MDTQKHVSRKQNVGAAALQPLYAAKCFVQARPMFVIELLYKADLSVIDAHMAAHVKFLKKYYKSGNFLDLGPEGTPRWRDHHCGWQEPDRNRSDRP